MARSSFQSRCLVKNHEAVTGSRLAYKRLKHHLIEKIVLLVLAGVVSSLSAATAPAAAESWTEPVSGIRFVWIEPGCFMMGQSEYETKELLREAKQERYERFYSDELPRHRVCVDGFWLAATETTQRQWLRVSAEAPFKPDPIQTMPAYGISWQDAVAFARLLGEKSGLSFRLPTEAEWEYAARAGTETPFSTGATISTDEANYNGLYIFGDGRRGAFRESATPVASFPANPFGLYDMHGNLWEWCADWYFKTYYRSSPPRNPKGPAKGKKKVLRGGSWYTKPRSVRSANRHADLPDSRVHDYGFRLVVVHPPPERQQENNRLYPDDF